MVRARLPHLSLQTQRILPAFLLLASLAALGCSLRTSALEAMGPPAPPAPIVPPRDRPGLPQAPETPPPTPLASPSSLVRVAYYQPPELPPAPPSSSTSLVPPGVLPLPDVQENRGAAAAAPAVPAVPAGKAAPPALPSPPSVPGGVIIPPGTGARVPGGVILSPQGSPAGPGTMMPPAAPGAVAAPPSVPPSASPSESPSVPPAMLGTEVGVLPTPGHGNEVVVNLAAVLHLVDERNPQLLLEREEVHEAVVAYNTALCMCLPQCCREDQFHTTRAEARVWKERAELARDRYGILNDAGATYVNWITARRTEAIFASLENQHRRLLQRAEGLAREERSAELLVSSLKTVIAGHEQIRMAQRQLADSAAIKLISMMNLPDTCLVPQDQDLPVLELVDATLPCEALLTQALTLGPAVRELEQLRAVLLAAIYKANCLRTLAKLGCASACGQLAVLMSKEQQVELRLEKARSELAGGVVQARDAILIGRQRIAEGMEQVRDALDTFNLSSRRLRQHRREEAGTVYTQVIQSIHSLELAELSYVGALNGFDRAEVRLYLLLGNDPRNNPWCGYADTSAGNSLGGAASCSFTNTTPGNALGGNTCCGFTNTTPGNALGGNTCCGFTPAP